MSTKRLKKKWIARYRRDRSDFFKILSMDPFENWERNMMPEISAENGVWLGFDIVYAGDPDRIAQKYLEQTLLVAARIESENKLESPRCVSRFPMNRGRMLRARTYARAALGHPFDKASLLQASHDYEQYFEDGSIGSEIDYDDYLNAIRLALLADDVDRAHKLSESENRRHADPELLYLITELASAPPLPGPDQQQFLARFDRYFDRVRDPGFVPRNFCNLHILRIELAALRDKYFQSPDGVIDWRRVVDAVSF